MRTTRPRLRARQVRMHDARLHHPLTLRNRPASDPTDAAPFTRGIDSLIRKYGAGPPGAVGTTSSVTVKCRITVLELVMTAAARFDLKMDADEKAMVAKAAALLGITMAGFVRVAAKEKAQVLLDREARITLTDRDFTAFARALDSAFAPNPALKAALTRARRKVRRA